MIRHAPLALTLAGAFLMSACQDGLFGSNSDAAVPLPCPRVVKVGDAETVTRFQGVGRDVKDVLFEARIGDVASGCVYVEDEGKLRIEMTMQVQTIAARGPANQEEKADFEYFVAVAQVGGGVLARQTFDVSIPLEGNETRAQSVDELGQTVFLKSGQNGDNYVIYVGLIVTPEELAYNRGSAGVAAPEAAPATTPAPTPTPSTTVESVPVTPEPTPTPAAEPTPEPIAPSLATPEPAPTPVPEPEPAPAVPPATATPATTPAAPAPTPSATTTTPPAGIEINIQ